MKHLFIVPENHFDDFYDKARFALTWKICWMFTLVIGVVTGLSVFANDTFYPFYVGVLSLVIGALIYMHIYGKFKLVSVVLMLGTTGIIIGSVFTVPNVVHIIEIVWMLVIVLYMFFTLGRWFGYFFLILTAAIFITYFNTLFYPNLLNIQLVTDLQWGVMSVELAFAMVLIGFIVKQFIDVNEYAENMRSNAFEALKSEKIIVEKQHVEKTVLLQEIHHRVKNNLQVIISLLRIQSQELKSEEARKSFNEAISRIMTMSLIHQKMYERQELSRINLQEYFSTLIDDMLSSSVTTGKVSFNLSMETEEIGSKTIAPLALIINELISNSLKHAFESEGEINIHFSTHEDGRFELVYSDNGTWKSRKEGAFGLQLIDIFTEQLDGEYARETFDTGTTYRFLLSDLDRANNT
jgi:two-component sensor histidine kinase